MHGDLLGAELAVAGRVQLSGEVGATSCQRPPVRHPLRASDPLPRRGWPVRSEGHQLPGIHALLELFPSLLAETVGGRRGALEQVERLAVLLNRPVVRPREMGTADPSKPLAAQMALHPVLVGVVGDLTKPPVIGSAVRQAGQ